MQKFLFAIILGALAALYFSSTMPNNTNTNSKYTTSTATAK